MTVVDQYDTTQPIPFEIRVNSGNYPGDASASPTVTLSKSGGQPISAQGTVTNVGGGLYWFWPATGVSVTAQQVNTARTTNGTGTF